MVLLGCVAIAGGFWIAKKYSSYGASNNSLLQNLARLGATDVCEMFPVSYVGTPFDRSGERIAPSMTIYLRAPENQRPTTGDVLEILFPEQLEGRVRFTQATNDGYGGSGSLVWIDEAREAELGLAVWDFTTSGSLQYSNGNTLLWGDCRKARDLTD